MRFYTLKNVKVADIVQTLQSIERTYRPQQTVRRTPQSGIRGRDGFRLTGPNNFSGSFREGPPLLPPNFVDSSLDESMGRLGAEGTDVGGRPSIGQPGAFDQFGSFRSPALNNLAAIVSDLESPSKLIPGDAQLTVDEKTNTLIVVAEPEVQALYAQLIQRLDVRRPQVLIEAHVVIIEGRDELNLGVEISGGDRSGEKKLFAFSSFGLSDVDGGDGLLKLIPGLGFNGTLIDSDTADVVIRALASHSRSRVISSPKVVVEDNANGLLSSVAEQPFASVNATNTVATTSFAGFAQAGTTINVTPRISENDYLNLEFDILVNSFTGEPAPNLPPPRNTDQIVSQVTLPDGYTIVVGGLNRQRVAQTNTGIPFIENMPIIKHLGSNKTNQYSDGMMFIFLKPTILRDDRFRDLIYLSAEEQIKALLDSDFPQSCPQLIR
jgi:type II secretory pathway component GspD/PulD (secretin)